MYVVATAGHVDHGKSTLVRALTGMEPDRWAEEKRRGLTIDLGFAWTELRSGRSVAFVDVPGHERFLGNMLAGLGPAPVVCFVVAVDEGWQAQSSDHRDAVAALGITRGMIVLTKADRAPERVAAVLSQVRAELAGTGLREAPAVVVSAQEGAGLDEFRATLDAVLADVPPPATNERVRLWIDRAFSVSGAGTIVTGTLTGGTLHTGDSLGALGEDSLRAVTVRSLQSHNASVAEIGPVNRVAVNLRGVAADQVGRGDVLLTPDTWPLTDTLDVRRATGAPFTEVPVESVVHVGSAAVPARLRPLDADHARLQLRRTLPLVPGDRLVLRYPGGRVVLGGAHVLDIDPRPLERRGDSTRHAAWLSELPLHGDARLETLRRGAVRVSWLRQLGLLGPSGTGGVTPAASSTPARPGAPAAPAPRGTGSDVAAPASGVPHDIRAVGDWWLHAPVLAAWCEQLGQVTRSLHDRDPVAAGLSRGAARNALSLPHAELLDVVIAQAGLEQRDGFIRDPQRAAGLGKAEAALAELERRLTAQPFAAPEADELSALGLGPRELAAAQRQGRVLRLDGGVVLLPQAPALAMRELARLEQPFTTSQARQAWGTTRRVAIPLLEYLDSRGWTRREDGTHRSIAR